MQVRVVNISNIQILRAMFDRLAWGEEGTGGGGGDEL